MISGPFDRHTAFIRAAGHVWQQQLRLLHQVNRATWRMVALGWAAPLASGGSGGSGAGGSVTSKGRAPGIAPDGRG